MAPEMLPELDAYQLSHCCHWCDLLASIFVDYEWTTPGEETVGIGVMAFCGHHARCFSASEGKTLVIHG